MKKMLAVIICVTALLAGCATTPEVTAPEVVAPPVIEEPAPAVEETVPEPEVIEPVEEIIEVPAVEEVPVVEEPVIEEIPVIEMKPDSIEVDTETDLQDADFAEPAVAEPEPEVTIKITVPEPAPVVIAGTADWEAPAAEQEGTPWWIYAAIGAGAVILVIIIVASAKSAKKSKIRKNAAKVLPSYVVLETCTSALDPKHGKIIEIALKKVSGRQEQAVYSSLINPGSWIPEEITGITGITDPMLVDAPALEEVWGEIKSFIDNQVLVGYNILFDLMFLEAETGEKLTNKVVEILPVVKKFLPDLTDYRLTTVAKALGIQKPEGNRAAANADLQSMVLEKFIDMSAQQGNPLVF